MYFRLASLLPIAALATFVAAAPDGLPSRGNNECSTGTFQCCQNTYDSQDETSEVIGLLSLLGLNIGNLLVGLGCTNVLSTSCVNQPVCCTGNSYNGLINIGCSPINL